VTTSEVNRLALSEELPGLELAFKSLFLGGKEAKNGKVNEG